jgi:hypothetical protein
MAPERAIYIAYDEVDDDVFQLLVTQNNSRSSRYYLLLGWYFRKSSRKVQRNPIESTESNGITTPRGKLSGGYLVFTFCCNNSSKIYSSSSKCDSRALQQIS